MILASSLLCNSRSSGVSSVGGQDSGTTVVSKLTLAIVGNNDHNLSTVHVDGGLNRGGQFAIRRREEMMSRIDDGELSA
jgi:hypothetical protein